MAGDGWQVVGGRWRAKRVSGVLHDMAKKAENVVATRFFLWGYDEKGGKCHILRQK